MMYDSVCNCFDMKKYEYLNEQLRKAIVNSWCGDDLRKHIADLLIEVEKPYKDAKIPE